ncbi:Cytochrome c554 and c-prime TPR repeat containing protein, putative [Babesia ovata]|uniref:Cytochrome c554 and c-prime TPR repeat containing protein, putative n=1 Tax=Babesia ovata TaxID=189622 RepID=A0A2H6KAU0_9APIC|nr:Cytochrome c554 and c-prime TPR repeat containing protein, putative [Babesia ovata]GBE60113.1 Cytochrome c554 and c-prime TPR repeat containing protein, putative [Babesia ovata]
MHRMCLPSMASATASPTFVWVSLDLWLRRARPCNLHASVNILLNLSIEEGPRAWSTFDAPEYVSQCRMIRAAWLTLESVWFSRFKALSSGRARHLQGVFPEIQINLIFQFFVAVVNQRADLPETVFGWGVFHVARGDTPPQQQGALPAGELAYHLRIVDDVLEPAFCCFCNSFFLKEFSLMDCANDCNNAAASTKGWFQSLEYSSHALSSVLEGSLSTQREGDSNRRFILELTNPLPD